MCVSVFVWVMAAHTIVADGLKELISKELVTIKREARTYICAHTDDTRI